MNGAPASDPADGEPALPDRLAVCPISGEHLPASRMAECGMCRQAVSPQALRGGRCYACRHLQRVRKDEARMARVLHEHPTLDRWSGWRMAETASVYVLTASSFWRRLLVVLRKDTLEALRVAEGVRLLRIWTDLPPVARDELLH